MKKIIVACDVDGTLIKDGARAEEDMKVNWRVARMLATLADFKNVRIVVWSGGGKKWAEAAVVAAGIEDIVWRCYSKNLKGRDAQGNYIFEPEIVPDIAIDDIHACELGTLNLIVDKRRL